MHKQFATLCAIVVALCGHLSAATNPEKALLNRYVTLITFALQDAEGAKLARLRQEALMIGVIGFYYYRDSDSEFADNFRSLSSGFLKQSKTTLATELPKFNANFSAPTTEADSMRRLSFWGIDPATSKRIVADARKNDLKAFKEWMNAHGKDR